MNWVQAGPQDVGTVVMIHAVGYDLTYWDRQFEALCRKYNVVVFDLPGHGRSPADLQGWTFDKIAHAVAVLIETIGAGPVNLMGISFGGMVAQATVLARPDLVQSLTLIGTACTFPEPIRAAMRERAKAIREGGMQAVLQSSLERWFTPETRLRRPDLMDRVTKTILGDDPVVQAAIWEMIANEFDVQKRLGEIQCPTLVLVGDRDPSTPPSTAAVLANGITGARMRVLPETSHLATVESPELVNAELLQFLRSVTML